MALGEFVLPLAGAGLAAVSWELALGAQGLLLPLAVAGALVLLDTRSDRAGGTTYRAELVEAVRQPGMPAVLAAGFLRFVAKFAIIAYLPFLLVQERGATLAQGALVLGVASGVAAAVNLLVPRLLRRARASVMLIGAVSLVAWALVGFAVAPTWEVALAVSVAFGLGDGVLMLIQNTLVTEAAPDAVRAGLVAVSGMTRNAGKLLAPLAMGALILAVPMSASFAVVGVVTLAAVPGLRSLRRMDGLLRRV